MSHIPVPGPCRAFLHDFSAFVDGELSPRRRDEIQAHVDCCQSCLDHLTAYRRGITVLRSIEAEAPADFWTRLEQRLWVGPELTVLEGGRRKRRRARGARWSAPAVSLAAAAVLGLFVVARGLGPGSAPMHVGPDRIQASVAMTLPAVPESGALASADPGGSGASVRRTRRASSAAGSDLARLEPARLGAGGSIEREIRRFEERILEEPVRLGSDRWSARIQPASLVRPAASVTPAPWNVDRALSLP